MLVFSGCYKILNLLDLCKIQWILFSHILADLQFLNLPWTLGLNELKIKLILNVNHWAVLGVWASATSYRPLRRAGWVMMAYCSVVFVNCEY